MKKVIIFLLIISNNIQLLFSQVNLYQLDKISKTSEDIQRVYTYVLPQTGFQLKEIYYQDSDNGWKTIWRDTLFYDEKKNITQVSEQGYRYNSEKDTYTFFDSKISVFNYDIYNNISEVYHSYEFLGWAVARMEKYEFNNNKFLMDEQELVWNFEDSYWKKESRYSYFFKGNNKLDSMLKYYTDKDGFTWNNYSKIFYTYINDNLVHSNEILYYGLEYVKSNYYYDGRNNLILKTDSTWDGSNERWGFKKDSMIWNENNLLIKKFILANRDTGWDAELFGIYEYDSLNRIKKFRIEGGTYWECTYDEEGNLIYETAVYKENDEWKPDQRYVYVYSEITEVKEKKKISFEEITIIFNDYSNNLIVSNITNKNFIVNMLVFNLIGQVIFKSSKDILNSNQNLIYYLPNLSSGLYFVLVSNQNNNWHDIIFIK